MSLAQVQARTEAIAMRLAALSGQPVPGPRALVGGSAAFTDMLAEARGAAGVPGSVAGANVFPGTGSGSSSSVTGASAVALAKTHLGTPYVFGGEQPGGFDCSGLVQWTYKQLGIDLPRRSPDQGRSGVAVPPGQAQPGDLVYFDRKGPIDHIGIYAGDGKWIVAPKTGDVVKLQDVDLNAATSIRRVTGTAVAAGADAGWAQALPAAGKPYAGAIARAAAAEGIDPALLSALAWTESGFRPNATSSAGAQGLVQLMPATARGLGVDALDPAQALQGGARYLRTQLDAFGGRADLALAAYNAGPTAVRRAGGIPDYPETQHYVTRVLDRYRQLGGTT